MLGGLFNSLSGASDSARQFILVRRGLRELLNFPWGQNTSWTSLEKLSANFTFFLRQVCALGFLPFWGVKQQTKDLICWAGVLWGGLGDNGRAGDMGRGTPALRGGTAARLGRSEAPAPPCERRPVFISSEDYFRTQAWKIISGHSLDTQE